MSSGFKLGTLLLLLGTVGLGLYLARRRLKLALLIGGGTYAVLTLGRLLFALDEPNRLAELAFALGGFVAVWVIVWAITRRAGAGTSRRRRAR